MARAREVIEHFFGEGFALPEGVPPPPGFNLDKIFFRDVAVDDGYVLENLLDLEQFPEQEFQHFGGVLEMLWLAGAEMEEAPEREDD